MGQDETGIDDEILAAARQVWGVEAAAIWLSSANAHLGGARPVDVARTAGTAPVLAALDAEAWGGGA